MNLRLLPKNQFLIYLLTFMQKSVLISAAFCLACLLGSCQRLLSEEVSVSTKPDEVPAEARPDVSYGTFPPETLYAILVSEIAMDRGHPEIALKNYLAQAEKTGDPGVAERATKIAIASGVDKLISKAVEIWVDVAPNDSRPYQVLALQLIKQKKFSEAFAAVEKAIVLSNDVNLSSIAYYVNELEKPEREIFNQEFDKLIQKHPQNTNLILGKIIIFKLNEQYDNALSLADILLVREPEEPRWMLLKAELLVDAKKSDNAIKWLDLAIKNHPDQQKLQVYYAKILYDQNQHDKAYQAFEKLHQAAPQNPDYLLSMALIAVDKSEFDLAKIHLHQLIEMHEFMDEAYYYLGLIAEKEKNLEQAIAFYEQVVEGPNFLHAYGRRMYLYAERGQFDLVHEKLKDARSKYSTFEINFYLIEANVNAEHKRYDKAFEIVNEALAQHPDHIDLLYNRALIAEKRNDLGLVEKDLRKIISIDPKNAAALNALGYSLTNSTNRFEEALSLIKKAYEIDPKSPAILDSLGWVYYRMGDAKKALGFLEKAYEGMPDHEVAAHLGEVLWKLNQKEKAKKVWNEALEKTPDSDIIKETMQRLQ